MGYPFRCPGAASINSNKYSWVWGQPVANGEFARGPADERYLSGRITARDQINPLKSNYKRQRVQRTA